MSYKYKDPEYHRKYREKNKEKIAENNRKYREKNKEYYKKYREKNKEKLAECNKVYNQSSTGKKSNRINNWKQIGILHDNYDELYKEYIETERCDICGIYLTEDKRTTSTTRCLDHDHETGFVRNILCCSCNIKRG
tara:strand:- start:5 stop:412 length:408 start_codon:yes stop_codon:yes gene_type:complete